MAIPYSGIVVVKGVRIHLEMAGQGVPVVLIHGLYSSTLMNWQMPGIFNELAKTHQVIGLDLPGHGQSDKPTDPDAYGNQMVEDVLAVMDRLKIPKAHIVGYSLGGLVALKFIILHEDRVLSGFLGGMGMMEAGSGTQGIWGTMHPNGFLGTPPICVKKVADLAVTASQVRGVQVPVEVVVGDRDPCYSLYVVPLEKVRSDWTVIRVKGAGHITCVTKPQFKKALADWLR
jgi:pimeloyl-ACP methyl ester carboxylesterase